MTFHDTAFSDPGITADLYPASKRGQGCCQDHSHIQLLTAACAHTLSLSLTSPVPSQRQRCFQQQKAAVHQRHRCLCPVLFPAWKTPGKIARLHREVKEGIKWLDSCPSAPTACIGSTQGTLVNARPRDYEKQQGRRERTNECWTGTCSTSLGLCTWQLLITEDSLVVLYQSALLPHSLSLSSRLLQLHLMTQQMYSFASLYRSLSSTNGWVGVTPFPQIIQHLSVMHFSLF